MDLARELDRFDPAAPIEVAATPPSSWYTAAQFFALESQSVLADGWHFACRAEQVAAPGSFACALVQREPIVLLRDSSGVLRGFFNVCRHHAAELVAGEGRAESLVCPYHGWTYALDGRLLRAPGLGGIREFDRDSVNLVPVAVETLGPLVFVSAESNPAPLLGGLGSLPKRLGETDWEGLRFVERRRYELACNWKVVIDNYLDGGYHVAPLHGDLAGQLDLESYATEVGEDMALQTVGAAPDSERLGAGAVYAWMYPGFMINRYGPVLDTNAVIALDVDRTAIVYDYFFAADCDAEMIERSLAASDAVQREDTGVCESVQRGLASRGFQRGRYAPALERAAHHFHARLARQLRTALHAGTPPDDR